MCDEVGHSNLAQEAKDPQLELTGVSVADVVSVVGDVEVDVNLCNFNQKVTVFFYLKC